MPPAEAMASGCAVVCSNIGGHLDYAINRETALLFEPENIEEIVEKIELLYIYSAVAATSILYTILSLYYPKIPAEINSYISLIPKNNIVSWKNNI